MGSVRVAIVGVGNCASSLVQGVEYYRNADPNDRVPGLMHVKFGDYHVVRRAVRRRLRRGRQEGRQRHRRGDRRQREQHHQDLRRAAHRRASSSAAPPSTGWASTTARWSRSPTRPPVDVVAALRDAQVDVVVSLPAGRLGAGGQVLRPGRHRRRVRVRQRAAGVHRLRPGVGAEVHRRRAADRRRRHQVPGRRDHRPPRPGQAVRGPRRRAAAHVPAQLRRQHGLHEHAGARPAWSRRRSRRPSRSPRRSRTRWSKRRRPHRTVRPRAVARRPQVGLHPARGPGLRRRAAQRGAQARGLGLAQLGRHHHRRHPGREDRPGPEDRRPDPVRVVVLHEVAAGAVRRPRRARRPSRTSSRAPSSAEPLRSRSRRRRSPPGTSWRGSSSGPSPSKRSVS